MLVVVLVTAMVFLVPIDAVGQSYTGKYMSPASGKAPVVLTLQQRGRAVSGTLAGTGFVYPLEGKLDAEGIVAGKVRTGEGQYLLFEADLLDDDLDFTIGEAAADGTLNYDTARELLFVREGSNERDMALPQFDPGVTQEGFHIEPSPAPRQTGIHDETPLGQQVAGMLAGRRLTYRESYSSGRPQVGGYGITVDVDLCSDGQFAMFVSNRISVPNMIAPPGSRSQPTGNWRVRIQGSSWSSISITPMAPGMLFRSNDAGTRPFWWENLFR